MPVHTDILDNALFLVAPLALALGLIWPRIAGRALALFAMVLVALLLVDMTVQLPFPAGFPGDAPSASDVAMGLWWVASGLVLAVLVAPRSAAWLLGALLIAPALSIVVFITAAVAACNPYAHHDGIAHDALARAAEQSATLGVLAAVVYAAAAVRPSILMTLVRSVTAGALAGGAAWWGGGPVEWGLVGAAAILPWAPHSPWPRTGLGVWVTLTLRWERIAWLAAFSLAGALLVGVLAHLGYLPDSVLGDHAGAGWVQVDGAGILPMTAVFALLPLLLAALATTAKPQFVPGLPARWSIGPGWAVLGAFAAAGTILALLVQGESGLSALVLVALVGWWLATSGRVRQTLLLAMGGSAVMVIGLLAMYRSPVLLAAASDSLDRLSWMVLGYNDGRAHQFHAAWQFFRDVGWWGTGLRDPGGPVNVPAWTNDFLTMTTARFLGVCGAVGIVGAALLPACAAARGAAAEAFDADADLARPAAMFTVPWAILWGGGAVWVSAGAMGILPLSGLTMGLASPSLNHLIWTLPVVAWIAARCEIRAATPLSQPNVGLRGALRVTWVGIGVAAVVLLTLGWQRLADRDEAWVLPLDLSGTLRLTADGDAVRVEDGGDQTTYSPGKTFTLGDAVLRVVAGPSVEVAGVVVDANALSRGFNLGLAGRHAPLHPGAPWMGDRIALFNDLWLEDASPTRWRELTIRRAGPSVFAVAPVSGSSIQVIGLDGSECAATNAGDKCPLSENARIEIRGVYSFVVHLRGPDLALDWLDGRPAPRLVPRATGLLVGDRRLAPREASDQVWVDEARAELGLLGEVGILYVDQGVLRVRDVPSRELRESEPAVYRAADVARRVWLRKSAKCAGGWAWSGLRDPLGSEACVDKSPMRSVVRDGGGRVVSVKPHTRVLETLTQAEARTARGMIRDRHASPLFTWKDGVGWVAVEPWLAWLGERGVKDVVLHDEHPELGTRTTTSYTGLQRVFHRLLTGRVGAEDPWAELWRRLLMTPRPSGVDLYTTLSLPVMRVAAEVAQTEARRLAETARARGPSRQKIESRDCKAWDVNVVLVDLDGAILAAVTAVGMLDDKGNVSVVFETGAAPVDCLPSFDGPLRALSAPIQPGSTQKVWMYALAAELALEGDPLVQFEARDGDLWLVDHGDPDNGDGHFILDPGDLERVYGQNVPDCHNHGLGEGEPIRFIDAFARSGNAAACFLAAASTIEGDRIGPVMRALQLDGSLDLLPSFDDPDLDRSRLPVGSFALGGRVGPLADGTVSLAEVTKMPLGQGVSPTTLGLTGAVRMIGNGGVYTSPYLLLGTQPADGAERRVRPPPPVRVVSKEAAGWTAMAMHAVVSSPGGTGFSAMVGLSPFHLAHLGLKTGTADMPGHLPSPKAVVALYPTDSPSPVSIAVWVRHAQGLDDQAALRVVRDIVESGVLDTTVASAP